MNTTIDLTDLAPVSLHSQRRLRFDGDGFGLSRTELSAEDRQLLEIIYHQVKSFHEYWRSMRTAPDMFDLRRRLEAVNADLVAAHCERLGNRSDSTQSPPMRKALHDVRGGALTMLLNAKELLLLVDDPHALLIACVHAARDHAKMIRNAIVDIDADNRAADKANRVHAIQEIVRTWHGAPFVSDHHEVRVEVHCTYTGAVTGCCLETAALDRVLYNYVNNAVRFAAASPVTLSIFPVNPDAIRWVVSNALTPDDAHWLADRLGEDLRRLFDGGTTHGGNGIGLSACAEIIASCFGVPVREAIEQGYLGARVAESQFHAWFHWSAFDPAPNAPTCPCDEENVGLDDPN